MATQKKSSASKSNAAARSAAKNSDSDPAKIRGAGQNDPGLSRAEDVDNTSAAMPFNETKPSEYGHANVLAPIEGTHVKVKSPAVSGSTRSESNGDK